MVKNLFLVVGSRTTLHNDITGGENNLKNKYNNDFQ